MAELSASMSVPPQLDGVIAELREACNRGGLSTHDFLGFEHLKALPAVDRQFSRPVPPIGGRAHFAKALVKCVVDHGRFSRSYHQEVLRWVLFIGALPNMPEDCSLMDRRNSGATAVDTGKVSFKTAEQHAILDLATRLLDLRRSPCVDEQGYTPLEAAMLQALDASAEAVIRQFGWVEFEQRIDEVRRQLAVPAATSTRDVGARLKRAVKNEWSRALHEMSLQEGTERLLDQESMLNVLTHAFDPNAETDLYRIPITGSVATLSGAKRGPLNSPENAWYVQECLRNSLILLADIVQFHADRTDVEAHLDVERLPTTRE